MDLSSKNLGHSRPMENPIDNKSISQRIKERENIFDRFGFFIMMIMCMLLASSQPKLGGANGVINGNVIIWYFAVPLTYFEAGLICSPKSVYSSLCNGYLLAFVMAFMYILIPIIARLESCLLTHARVNTWLLKGMEVLYCMPPPFSVSLVLSRLANADLSTSVTTTLVSHFGGLFISPILLYFMLGASMPPLVGINIREMIYSTILPFGVGMVLQTAVSKLHFYREERTAWIPRLLLLLTAYHWFCDAINADVTSLHSVDILLCVLIACIGQLITTGLCWLLCLRWLPKNILLAALFTSTHKSIGLGGWLLRGAYHGSAHGAAISLPLSILPVAQLLMGSLLASWISP